MTVETEVANLTTAVDNLTAAVNVSKATLDAKTADAAASAATALTYQTGAQTAKTGAEAARDLAYGYQQSAASAVAYQNLAAIATSKAVTAVDVFVYDTSKDSDGGAWRKRCQHTSWYNETLNTATRGSRKDFPAVAVIVAEAAKVTIYDGDDPALPMWMVFNPITGTAPQTWRGNRIAQSVSAMNGLLALCIDLGDAYDISSGVVLMNFPRDTLGRMSHQYLYGFEPISVRNVGDLLPTFSAGGLVSNAPNDVAMTVLPDAPIDPATGLPVPTIAVATNGGVSVIKDDGTVVDSADTSTFLNVSWLSDGWLNAGENSGGWSVRTYPNPFTEGFGATLTSVRTNVPSTVFDMFNCQSADNTVFMYSNGYGTGFGQLYLDRKDVTKSLYCLTRVPYTTGWMPGDIKGAFLSDTDTSSLVGSNLRTDTFDNVTDWVKVGSASHTLASVSGEAVLTKDATNAGDDQFEVVLTVTTGQRVKVSIDGWRVSGAGAARISMYDNSGAVPLGSSSYAVTSTHERLTAEAVATNGAVRVRLNCGGGAIAGAAGFDNLTIDIADSDRSVNNKGLIVNGTITRSPVATGANLVGYSGFSSSNYLEQPYNSALDFGTGPFCIMAWAQFFPGSNCVIASRTDYNPVGWGSDGWWTFGIRTTPNPGALRLRGYNLEVVGNRAITDTGWHFCAITYDGSTACIYVDGDLDFSGAKAINLVGTNTPDLLVGVGSYLGNITDPSYKLALLRISATAPTADQIKKIYEDEKVLFQENAQCTIYGTSYNVTALAHDSDTGLLHVGTSAGRSVFQGLRRVSNTTTAVGTAISASNGLVVDE